MSKRLGLGAGCDLDVEADGLFIFGGFLVDHVAELCGELDEEACFLSGRHG